MNGSVLVLLGCFALLFAAPSHSYSVKPVSEDDQLANRQDAQSESRNDAATSGDDVENADTRAGESANAETDGGADPGNESVPEDTQAGKSEARKRDTRSLVGGTMSGPDYPSSIPVNTDLALYMLRLLGEYGGTCFDQALSYLQQHESPLDFRASQFTRSDMIRWLEFIRGSMAECLGNAVDRLESEIPFDDTVKPRPGEVTVSEFLSWLTYIGKTLDVCLGGAIWYLESRSHGPGEGPSEPFVDLWAELVQILSQMDGGGFAVGNPGQTFPPGHTEPPYLDPVPVLTPYKKSSPFNPGVYPHLSYLPGYTFQYLPHLAHTQDIPDSMVPQFSGFRAQQVPETSDITTLQEDVTALPIQQFNLLNMVLEQIYSGLRAQQVPETWGMTTLPEGVSPLPIQQLSLLNTVLNQIYSGSGGVAGRLPDVPGITTLPEDVSALPTQPFSLLNTVLNQIYSQLNGAVSPDVNMEAATVEDLRADGLYPGDGDSLGRGNAEFDPDYPNSVKNCANERSR